METAKTLICTFKQLSDALFDLHLGHQADIDRLHDLWKLGAPTPDSIIRNPKGYDERKAQPGNLEKRIIVPTALTQWIMDVSTRRGMPLTAEQAAALASGETRFV